MITLENQRRLIVSQAIIKNWNNKTDFLINDKLKEELKEFYEAIETKDPYKIANEIIDVEYIMLQILHNFDLTYKLNMNDEFKKVYNANWKLRKKTKDEKGIWVRR